MKPFPLTILLVLALFEALPVAAQDTSRDIFIEAENSFNSTFSGPAKFDKIVSGDRILRLWESNAPPPEGYRATFRFTTAIPDTYHVWIAASLPPATSNFWWQVDNGKWGHVTPDTENTMLNYGVSNVMGWVKLATTRLEPGTHTLTIRVNERRGDNEHAYLLYLDAMLITPRDVYPRGLVTGGDVAKLLPKPPPPAPVPRAGLPGPPMLLGTSVMTAGRNRIVKALGFSLSQTDSDHLNVNETAPGQWDWTHADAELAACRRAGLKWQYFPHFHWAPAWYRQSDKFVPCTGLRSARRLPCISLWSPDILPWYEHGYAALAQHYGSGADAVAAIYLGIYGDFGETIFPMGWHPDELKRFGESGTGTPDFWCGDDFARLDFGRFARQKYGRISRLNATWGTRFASFEALDYPALAYSKETPPPPLTTPQQRRYWLDFLAWYYGSMTHFTEQVCAVARRHFPQSLLSLPVGGGGENVLFAQDTTALPRIAKKYDVHIRSTHGGYKPFATNYGVMLKRIATPCKFYGVPHWLEPPGTITPEAEVSRFMEALSCGNWAFWDWGNNPIGAQDVFREYTNFFTQEKPVVDVALFFPTTDHRLNPQTDYPPRLAGMAADLRDVMDYDMVDEELMADGALNRYRVLIWLEGTYSEAATLTRIKQWVEHGGTLLWCGNDPMQTVEGDTKAGRDLLGLAAPDPLTSANMLTLTPATGGKLALFLRHLNALKEPIASGTARLLSKRAVVLATAEGQPVTWAVHHGKGWVVAWAGGPETDQTRHTFYELARDVVYNLSKLDATKADAPELDNAWDGVYATLLANNEVILLNASDQPHTKTVAGTQITLPPASLRSVLAKR